jgi:hypothetical protein
MNGIGSKSVGTWGKFPGNYLSLQKYLARWLKFS